MLFNVVFWNDENSIKPLKKLMDVIFTNVKLKGIKQISISVTPNNFTRYMYENLEDLYFVTVDNSSTIVKSL